MSDPAEGVARLLVLAPTGRDAPLIAGALAGQCEITLCPHAESLLPQLAAGAGAVLIAEEAITPALLRELVIGIRRQEPWSDVPFVVLGGKPPMRGLPDWASRDVLATLEPLGNVTVLERPVRIRNLLAVVRVALESRKRQQQMRVLHESVQTMSRAKDEFLAMLSHELRNPLSAVRTAIAVLQRDAGSDPARTRRYLEILDRQSLAMKRMLDDLLDVSRLSLGKVRLELQQVDLAVQVRQTAEGLQAGASALGHTLIIEGPREGLWVQGDPVRLEQIITNVVGNALKYTPRGGRIAVTFGREGGDAVISVRDNGIGLEAAMVSRVFELFTQAPLALDRAQGGLGVGLALVDNLVKMHGGHVTASSEGLGKGCEFRILLPATEAVTQLPAVPRRASAHRRLRVVVVDDNEDLRDALLEVLAGQGHEVTAAATGVAAVELARSAAPDVLLVDIGLPGISGYEVARRVRASCSADIQLVAITGYGRAEDLRRSHEAGFDEHLVKPVDPQQLDQLFARIAGRRASGARRDAN